MYKYVCDCMCVCVPFGEYEYKPTSSDIQVPTGKSCSQPALRCAPPRVQMKYMVR